MLDILGSNFQTLPAKRQVEWHDPKRVFVEKTKALGTLRVTVIRANKLPKMDITRYCDSYCVLWYKPMTHHVLTHTVFFSLIHASLYVCIIGRYSRGTFRPYDGLGVFVHDLDECSSISALLTVHFCRSKPLPI